VAAIIAFDRATHRREAEPEAPVASFFSV
jgi:hypothetical protein